MKETKKTDVAREDFEAYVRVQKSGKFNMFDPRARQEAGLPRDVYLAVMKQYGELQKKFGSS